MVFVHARNATVKTAMGLIEMAKNQGETCFFQPDQGPDYGQCEKQVEKLSVICVQILFESIKVINVLFQRFQLLNSV